MSVTLKALVDSGANGSIFINTPVAIDVAKLFQTTVVPLNSDCRIRGYDGKTEERVTHAIILHLAVDGRRQANVPMLIANLGQHDMILGRKWCEQHDIWLDVRNRRLVWPDQRPEIDRIRLACEKVVPQAILKRPKPDPRHQQDADRREKLMAMEDRVTLQGTLTPEPRRYQPPRTFEGDRRWNLAGMNRSLQGKGPRVEWHQPCPRPTKELPKVDIALIGAAGFHR